MSRGLTLIQIPCWWDGDIHSLAKTIEFTRPDLLSSSSAGLPISLNPPPDFFPSTMIPDVGELMLASFPVDSRASAAVSSWWIGEKYDGIRACWNPVRRKLYSRTARELYLLPSLNNSLPSNLFCDTELWFGRGQFSDSYVLVSGNEELICWHFLRMVVFDCPAIFLQKTKFENRYKQLLFGISKDNPFAIVAPRWNCQPSTSKTNISNYNNNDNNKSNNNNNNNTYKVIQTIIDDGGEGVILREPASPYEPGRSPHLIKLKTSHGDKEAIVLQITNEKSVELKLPNGKTFMVPPADVLIPNPKIGDIVSFTFENNSRMDIPLHPKIFRIRRDVSWPDVVQSSVQEKKFYNEYSKVGESYTARPMGHWNIKNIKMFLEKFAQNRNLDPLVADSWYNISLDDIHKVKHGRTIVEKFKGGYFQMLSEVFPEISFDKNVFRKTWYNNIENRRSLFEKFAEENDFDPLLAKNWTQLRLEKLSSYKGIGKVLSYYNNSVSRALPSLFPDIGLDTSMFMSNTPWHQKDKRRSFFEEYAKENSFDPLVPKNWYLQPVSRIMAKEGANVVVLYHKRSVYKAIEDLFPEIGLDKSKFGDPASWWFDSKNRRDFFEEYAKVKGFNPLEARNWYSQRREHITSISGARDIMSYHNNSVSQALLDLFPDIGLDKSKFRVPSAWNDVVARKSFFEDYATTNEFDSTNPENWYLHAPQLMTQKVAYLEHCWTYIQILDSKSPSSKNENIKDFKSLSTIIIVIFCHAFEPPPGVVVSFTTVNNRGEFLFNSPFKTEAEYN